MILVIKRLLFHITHLFGIIAWDHITYLFGIISSILFGIISPICLGSYHLFCLGSYHLLVWDHITSLFGIISPNCLGSYQLLDLLVWDHITYISGIISSTKGDSSLQSYHYRKVPWKGLYPFLLDKTLLESDYPLLDRLFLLSLNIPLSRSSQLIRKEKLLLQIKLITFALGSPQFLK